MKTLGKGSATVAKWILTLAQEFLDSAPDALHLLVGVRVAAGSAKQNLCIDLMIVTDHALFVALEMNAKGRAQLTPTMAAQAIARQAQDNRLIDRQLPIYAFWLNNQQIGVQADGIPVLHNAHEVQQFMARATANGALLPPDQVTTLVEGLLRQDVDGQAHQFSPLRDLGQALRHWVALPSALDQKLQDQFHRPALFGRARPLLPADINRPLAKALLARDKLLEDADYKKVVPNIYIVELNPDNYAQHYKPIEKDVCERWQTKLLEVLDTTNRRLGRQVYKLSGPLQVQVRPGANLAPGEVRILSQIKPAADLPLPASPQPCLELIPEGRRWPLRLGRMTIGRDPQCDIYLEQPAIQQARLVSGRHAYLVVRNGKVRLFDGATDGEPSTNGTFVNGRRVGPEGQELHTTDTVILGALSPIAPRPDTPGAVSLRFHSACEPTGAARSTLLRGAP